MLLASTWPIDLDLERLVSEVGGLRVLTGEVDSTLFLFGNCVLFELPLAGVCPVDRVEPEELRLGRRLELAVRGMWGVERLVAAVSLPVEEK